MLTRFSVGQVWKYKTREHESDSRIIVVRVDTEDAEHGTIVHIFVSNVALADASRSGGKMTYIGHLPYAEDALESSITELESETRDVPGEYEEGYRLWRQEYDRGEAGVFELPVADTINSIEESLSQGG